MSPDPDPKDVGTIFHSQRPIMQANPNRPEVSNFFEMQGRMPRIIGQQTIIAICQTLNGFGKTVVAIPEP